MTVNPYRGEVTVELGGEQFAARPTYAAILAWEEKTGRTTTELLMRLTSGLFSVKELVSILQPALKAGGANLSTEVLGDRVVQEGQTEVLRPVAVLLKNALTGGKEPEPGELKAEREPDEPPSAGLSS